MCVMHRTCWNACTLWSLNWIFSFFVSSKAERNWIICSNWVFSNFMSMSAIICSVCIDCFWLLKHMNVPSLYHNYALHVLLPYWMACFMHSSVCFFAFGLWSASESNESHIVFFMVKSQKLGTNDFNLSLHGERHAHNRFGGAMN